MHSSQSKLTVIMCGSKNFFWLLLLPFTQLTYCGVIDTAKNSPIDDLKLTSVQLICRHGDRNVMGFSFPNDENQSKDHWPKGYGELTTIGTQQHYELGGYLRRRYWELSPEGGAYSPDTIYVVASETDRTIESADANMAGLFPPTDEQKWNPNLDWQPVPVHVIPTNEDNMLQDTVSCPHFQLEQAEYLLEDDRFSRLIDDNRDLLSFIKENAGYQQLNFSTVLGLYSELFVENLKGFVLPDWAESLIQPHGDLERFFLNWYLLDTATTGLKKLRSGYLLKEILDRSDDKINSKLNPDRSMFMYFAHENTIATMMNSLGVFDSPQMPPYASCLIFELHGDKDENYVELFYKNTSDTVYPMEFPECGNRCPLAQLFDNYDDILPVESYNDACKLSDYESIPDGSNPLYSLYFDL